MSFQPKVLVLSGGGFRATLFHLGVVSYLRKQKLLKDLTDVYSVSGGSILAAHLALNWQTYNDPDDKIFANGAHQIVEFCRSGVRGRVVRRRILYWSVVALLFVVPPSVIAIWSSSPYDPLYVLGWMAFVALMSYFTEQLFSLSTLLQHEYSKFYSSSGDEVRVLKDLKTNVGPTFHLLNTDLTTGELGSFTDRGLFLYDREGRVTPYENTQLQVSLAVAASSAFPPVFEPVGVDHRLLSADILKMPVPHYFTDGGVYDNLGLNAARKSAEGGGPILVSNAERRFDVDLDGGFRMLLRRTWRTSDILMTRIGQFESAAGNSEEVRFALLSEDRINDFLPPEMQFFVRNIRTDLDDFSEAEVQTLIYRGYGAAMLAVEGECQRPTSITIDAGKIYDASNAVWLPYDRSYTGIGTGDAERSSKWRVRFWDERDRTTYWIVAVLVALLLFSWPAHRLYVSIPRTPHIEFKSSTGSDIASSNQWKSFPVLRSIIGLLPEGTSHYVLTGGSYRHRTTHRYAIRVRLKSPAAIIDKALGLNVSSSGSISARATTVFEDDTLTTVVLWFPKGEYAEFPVILLALKPNDGAKSKLKDLDPNELFDTEN